MKKILPIILIVVVAGLAIGGWLYFKQGKQVSLPGEGGIQLPVGRKEETFTGKLKDAIARGISMKCTFRNDYVSGTGYIKGKKYYGEITSEGQQGYVIISDDCMWTWDESKSQGVKVCFEPTEGDGSIWDMQDQSSTEGDYTCVPAAVSDSKFTPPSNIQFLDLDRGMEQGFGIYE